MPAANVVKPFGALSNLSRSNVRNAENLVREALEHEQIAYELEQATSWRVSHRKEA